MSKNQFFHLQIGLMMPILLGGGSQSGMRTVFLVLREFMLLREFLVITGLEKTVALGGQKAELLDTCNVWDAPTTEAWTISSTRF